MLKQLPSWQEPSGSSETSREEAHLPASGAALEVRFLTGLGAVSDDLTFFFAEAMPISVDFVPSLMMK